MSNINKHTGTTKISWCDMTLNPVIGCRNGCQYCYARGIAKRFAKQYARTEGYIEGTSEFNEFIDRIKRFEPTFLPKATERFHKKLITKTPKSVFMNSMSDIDYWSLDNILYDIPSILNKYSQHKYIFLTKTWFLGDIEYLILSCKFDIITGYTYDGLVSLNINFNPKSIRDGHKNLLNLEPLLKWNPLILEVIPKFDWVIIGGQSGRNSKPINQDWVRMVRDECIKHDIPFFFKQWGGQIKHEDNAPEIDGKIWQQFIEWSK